jgi:hypothetical protein
MEGRDIKVTVSSVAEFTPATELDSSLLEALFNKSLS